MREQRGADAEARDWIWPRHEAGVEEDQGLRERKKRQTRQHLSDTATKMFLERGFDAVRVSEIAEACGVSEKTVFNYFPTKEALLLDREEEMTAAIRQAVGDPSHSPVEGLQNLILDDLVDMSEWFAAAPDPVAALAVIRRFSELIESTPSLRAHQRDMMDRLLVVAAEAMAERAGMNPDDPEPQIAGDALMGLWRIQFHGLHKYSDGTRQPAEVVAAVSNDVRRAARLVDSGLWSFGIHVQGRTGQNHARAAAQAAEQARAQVRTAIAEAKEAWLAVRTAAHEAKNR